MERDRRFYACKSAADSGDHHDTYHQSALQAIEPEHIVSMEDFGNSIPPFRGQASHLASMDAMISAMVDRDYIDRFTVTRRLSGNSLVDDARPSMLPFVIDAPRKRAVSVSMCISDEGRALVTVPQTGGQTSNTTNSDLEKTASQDLEDSDGVPEGLSPEELSRLLTNEAHRTASLTTAVASSSGHPTLIPPSRSSYASKLSKKSNQQHRKARNQKLYETLVQAYGIDRDKNPVRRRLSTSALSGIYSIPYSAPPPTPRRNSTSAYQASSSSCTSLPNHRHSSILGPITLSSPRSPQDLCLAAIIDFEKTQSILLNTWSHCCRAPEFVPPINSLWNQLHNFNFAMHLFTALTTTPFTGGDDDEDDDDDYGDGGKDLAPSHNRDWLHPDARAQYMTWRLPAQKRRHQRLGIADDQDWAAWDDEADDNNNNNTHREKYPLSASQMTRFARVCFATSEMLWSLIKALKTLERAQHALVWAMITKQWGRYYADGSGPMTVAQCIDECVLVMRCPTVPWVRNARDQVCLALGLDVAKVPGGEEDGDQDEDEKDGGEPMVRGALLEEVPAGAEVVEEENKKKGRAVLLRVRGPRRLRIRIATLRARYYGLSLLPAKCSFNKLGKLASKTTQVLQELRNRNVNDAVLQAKVRDLRHSIRCRITQTDETHIETIELLDPDTRLMARPAIPLHTRIGRGIQAGLATIRGDTYLDDLEELFSFWDECRHKQNTRQWRKDCEEERTSWEETSEEDTQETESSGDRDDLTCRESVPREFS